LILIGISGKLIAAIWFTFGFAPELGWNKRSIFHLVFNELLWLIPLTLIFLRSLQVRNYLQQHENKDWLYLSEIVDFQARLPSVTYEKVVP